MADPAADPVVPAAPAAEAFSAEYVASLKKQIEDSQKSEAGMKAKYDQYEAKERERVSSWQPAAKQFISELLGEVDAEAKADMAPLQTWADEYVSKRDIQAQAPLARMVSCASAQLKRVREEASVGSKATETLGATMKELESLKESDSNKTTRIAELEELVKEQQANAKTLQDELAKAGLMADKFDFSKVSSREKNAAPEGEEAKPVGLAAGTSNASRGAAMGNPFDTDLVEYATKYGGGGSLRVLQSGTPHALLGVSAASPDAGTADIMAALRAA